MAVPCRPREHGNAPGSVMARWGIAAGGSCAGADQGAPTGAGLWVGDLREGAVPEGGECRLPLLWPGLEGLGCFCCVLAIWSHMYGKAHCSLVKGFMGGGELVPERGTDGERYGRSP